MFKFLSVSSACFALLHCFCFCVPPVNLSIRAPQKSASRHYWNIIRANLNPPAEKSHRQTQIMVSIGCPSLVRFWCLFVSKKMPNNICCDATKHDHTHCAGQFTPKMKANAIPRLLSSLVWIDSGVVGTALIIFGTMHFLLISENEIFKTWRNYKFAWNSWYSKDTVLREQQNYSESLQYSITTFHQMCKNIKYICIKLKPWTSILENLHYTGPKLNLESIMILQLVATGFIHWFNLLVINFFSLSTKLTIPSPCPINNQWVMTDECRKQRKKWL